MKEIEPYKGIALIYDEIRPSYPEKLIEDIITKTDLKLTDKLLEIGAGTGKATIQFAEKGYTIHGVEIGEEMALLFREKCSKYPQVSLEVASFEDWDHQNNIYDMIYCAQAFHWLDPQVKYKKCHDILKDDGYLVLFWYHPLDETLPQTKEIEEKINNIVLKFTNQTIQSTKPQRKAHSGFVYEDDRIKEIDNSNYFQLVEKIDYTYETKNNASGYLKVKKSIPAFTALLDNMDEKAIFQMDKEIEELIEEYGGYVSTLFNFSLYIAKKIN